jgi:hypothetical protein
MMPRRARVASCVTACALTLFALTLPRVAMGQGQAQGQAARRDSVAPQGRRRAIDIRATAPAPEVVTIRPRVIPAFGRALLVPMAIQPPAAGDQPPATVVIFPGSLPAPRTAAPEAPRRPDSPTLPPE